MLVLSTLHVAAPWRHDSDIRDYAHFQAKRLANEALILRHESLEEEDNEHDVSLKPFTGTLRV